MRRPNNGTASSLSRRPPSTTADYLWELYNEFPGSELIRDAIENDLKVDQVFQMSMSGNYTVEEIGKAFAEPTFGQIASRMNRDKQKLAAEVKKMQERVTQLTGQVNEVQVNVMSAQMDLQIAKQEKVKTEKEKVEGFKQDEKSLEELFQMKRDLAWNELQDKEHRLNLEGERRKMEIHRLREMFQEQVRIHSQEQLAIKENKSALDQLIQNAQEDYEKIRNCQGDCLDFKPILNSKKTEAQEDDFKVALGCLPESKSLLKIISSAQNKVPDIKHRVQQILDSHQKLIPGTTCTFKCAAWAVLNTDHFSEELKITRNDTSCPRKRSLQEVRHYKCPLHPGMVISITVDDTSIDGPQVTDIQARLGY